MFLFFCVCSGACRWHGKVLDGFALYHSRVQTCRSGLNFHAGGLATDNLLSSR